MILLRVIRFSFPFHVRNVKIFMFLTAGHVNWEKEVAQIIGWNFKCKTSETWSWCSIKNIRGSRSKYFYQKQTFEKTTTENAMRRRNIEKTKQLDLKIIVDIMERVLCIFSPNCRQSFEREKYCNSSCSAKRTKHCWLKIVISSLYKCFFPFAHFVAEDFGLLMA